MNVLVIPEDQELDRYIVQPVLERLFEDLGRPARIEVLPEPRLRGAEDALDQGMVASIVANNAPMVDLVVLAVDHDCNRRKHTERLAARVSEHAEVLVGVLAKEEIECWMIAIHDPEQLQASWQEIRSHCDPKEAYAEPLLSRLGSTGPGGGRKAAMRSLKGNWNRLLSLCPEVRALRDRIRDHLAAR